MRLNRQTDYALRLLMLVGVKPATDLTRIKEVAGIYNISEAHLMKIVRKLGAVGVLETIRGRHGGFRLAKPADQIAIGAVVRAMEEDLALVQCQEAGTGPQICRLIGGCRLIGILNEALSAFLTVLDGYTLSDLTTQGSELALLLNLPVHKGLQIHQSAIGNRITNAAPPNPSERVTSICP